MTTIDVEHHRRELVEEGYTIVERLIPDSVVDELSAAVQRLERELAVQPGDNRFEGNRTVRTYNLLARDPAWQQVPVEPTVLGLVESVLGTQCLVSSLASISLHPGESAQVMHSDDQMFGLPQPHPAVVCNAMWALTDFTEANGATVVVPGSHTWDPPDYRSDDGHPDAVVAEMPRGSVLIWQGSTWHGGGANTSDEVRVGVAMNYCAGFIRQQENQQLGIPHETLATFSPQLRQLCGLGMYRGLTGNIDKRSPAEVLFGDPPQPALWDQEPLEPSGL